MPLVHHHSADQGLTALLSEPETPYRRALLQNWSHFVSLQTIVESHGGVERGHGSYLNNEQSLDYCPDYYIKQSVLYEVAHKLRVLSTTARSARFHLHPIFSQTLLQSLTCLMSLNSSLFSTSCPR